MINASHSGSRLTEEQLLMALIHDLRRHLRRTISRAQMIEREPSCPNSVRLREHLNEILAASRDADLLLGRLAQYAAVVASAEQQASGDISVMFDSALRRLTHRTNEAEIDAHAILDSGVQVPYSVEAILLELLDNALKFRDAPVKITLLVEASSDGHAFGIRDTGIGFDSRYRERIMLPMERLHPADVYEGCGMGLAICQRTVEALGGKLWAESKPGAGSTFWFSLPL